MSALPDEQIVARQNHKWTDIFFRGSRKVLHEEEAERDDHNAIELAIRLCLIAFLIYWTSIIVFPFAPIIAWSVIMAVALYPAFEWLSATLSA
jgi:hypothetical protein